MPKAAVVRAIPAWLDRAAAFTVGDPAGSTQLVLDAQSLGDLVPDKFAQVDMFQPLDPRATCLDVFTDEPTTHWDLDPVAIG